MRIPYILINFAKEDVFVPKGELLGNLYHLEENIQKKSHQYIHGNDEYRRRGKPKLLR